MAGRHHEVDLETLLIAEVVQVPGRSCMKARGSVRMRATTSGSSRSRSSVIFPARRGPVTISAGNWRAARR